MDELSSRILLYNTTVVGCAPTQLEEAIVEMPMALPVQTVNSTSPSPPAISSGTPMPLVTLESASCPSSMHSAPLTIQRKEFYLLTSQSVAALSKSFKKAGAEVRAWLETLTENELRQLSTRADAEREVTVNVGGGPYALLPAHLQLQCVVGDVAWARAGGGWLAISGAPGAKTWAGWKREGVTAVVTLLRESEPQFKQIERGCEHHGMVWVHAPLSGRGAAINPDLDDLKSWALLQETVPRLLSTGHHVILHCAAGMHRTGTAAFRTLRGFGLSTEESLLTVQALRPVTHGALLEQVKRQDGARPLWAVADELVFSD